MRAINKSRDEIISGGAIVCGPSGGDVPAVVCGAACAGGGAGGRGGGRARGRGRRPAAPRRVARPRGAGPAAGAGPATGAGPACSARPAAGTDGPRPIVRGSRGVHEPVPVARGRGPGPVGRGPRCTGPAPAGVRLKPGTGAPHLTARYMSLSKYSASVVTDWDRAQRIPVHVKSRAARYCNSILFVTSAGYCHVYHLSFYVELTMNVLDRGQSVLLRYLAGTMYLLH